MPRSRSNTGNLLEPPKVKELLDLKIILHLFFGNASNFSQKSINPVDISMTVAESGKFNGFVPMGLPSSVLASKPFDFSKYFIAHLYMTKKGKNSQIIFKII